MCSAANPEQAIEIDSGGHGGVGIEGVAGVNERADFFAARGRGKGGQHEAGASGRFRAADFSETSPGKAAGEGVDLGDAARSGVGCRAYLEARSWSDTGEGGRKLL